MNKQTKKWEILGKFKGQDIVGVLLKNRGIKTKKDRKEFFNPTPPLRISLEDVGISKKEVSKAIKRIQKARRGGEKVIVYGDYDADGICGTAILWETLYSLGLNVLPYIPERFSEGYGLNSQSIKRLKGEDPSLDLIITVDHGIVAHKKVDVAKDLGIDVIITDHHEPAKERPKPHALIHTTKIGGAAVAWVLSREIRKKFNHQTSTINHQLELVAIGTIADQIPLIGPNRSFVKYGLSELAKTKRPGLLALFNQAQIKSPFIGPYEVGFMIAPRLNAMGRLEHAMESLRLLCTKDVKRAEDLSKHLNRVNLERQKIVDEVVSHARNSIDKSTSGVIVLSHESYHEGVIGLAASKLVEEFYRPAIVISKKEKIAKASARSINGFDIIEAIRKVDSLIIEGGGHPMAAGFSIEVDKIHEFSKKLNEIALPLLTDEVLTKKLKVDCETHFTQLNWGLYKAVYSFEPMGLGNPTPTFVTKGVEILDARVVGRDSSHLKLSLKESGIILNAIGFDMGDIYPMLSRDAKVDIVFSLEENIWNSERKLELKIKDIRIKNERQVQKFSRKN